MKNSNGLMLEQDYGTKNGNRSKWLICSTDHLLICIHLGLFVHRLVKTSRVWMLKCRNHEKYFWPMKWRWIHCISWFKLCFVLIWNFDSFSIKTTVLFILIFFILKCAKKYFLFVLQQTVLIADVKTELSESVKT